MTSQLPLARPSNMSLADPNITKGENRYPQNHLQSLLDGFVDFSGVENCTLTFKGLSLNSKKVHEEYLFFACAGVGNSPQHGIAYAGEAINLGASCIAWEPTADVKNMPASCLAQRDNEKVNIPLIQVTALHECIGEIASRFYQHPSHSLHVIGITGTNGKTSTAHFIAQLIHFMGSSCMDSLGIDNSGIDNAEQANQCAVIGTLGNGLYGQLEQSTHTTPDAVTLQALIAKYRDDNVKTLVMEVSSHALSQGRVNGVEFDCAILTNLTRDHLDYHGDMKSYAEEKLKLFHVASLKQIVLNQDDCFADDVLSSLRSASSSCKHNASVVCYSRKDSSADYFADEIHLSSEGLSFHLHVKEAHDKEVTDKKDYIVNTHLVGEFNIENILASIAALHSQGYELNRIIASIEKLTVVPGRMEKIILPDTEMTIKRPLIVVDYAHTPDALEKGLCALKAHAKGKLICLFGCGGDRDKGKRPLMAKIAQQHADQVVVTSDNPRTESAEQIIEEIIGGFGFKNKVVIEIDREKAIHATLQTMSPDDVLLIAGKGHEDYQDINGEQCPFSDKGCVLAFYSSLSKKEYKEQESNQ